jgi:hypothetical protein
VPFPDLFFLRWSKEFPTFPVKCSEEDSITKRQALDAITLPVGALAQEASKPAEYYRTE